MSRDSVLIRFSPSSTDHPPPTVRIPRAYVLRAAEADRRVYRLDGETLGSFTDALTRDRRS